MLCLVKVDAKAAGKIKAEGDYWILYDDNTLELQAGIKRIPEWAFWFLYWDYCNDVKTLIIPYGVTHIGEGAFCSLSNLENINIPDSVEIIDKSAFMYCHSLKKVVIPDSVTQIRAGAFEGCRSLEEVVIPKSLTYINGRAFKDCVNLTNVNISQELLSNISIESVFENTPFLLSIIAPFEYKRGDFTCHLDKNSVLTLEGNGSLIPNSTGSEYYFTGYDKAIKTVHITSGTSSLSIKTVDEWGMERDLSLVSFFPSLNKIVNDSNVKIELASSDNYTWCDANDLTEPIYSLSKGTAVKVNKKLVKHYTIKFDGNGASSGTMPDFIAEVDSDVTIPKNKFEKSGYKFHHWEYRVVNSNNASECKDEESIRLSLDEVLDNNIDTLVLSAVWEDDYTKYTIMFDGNSASSGSMNEIVAISGDSQILPVNTFIKSGYKFKCWEYNLGSNSYKVNDKSSISIAENRLRETSQKSITLKAKWEKDPDFNVKNIGETIKDSKSKASYIVTSRKNRTVKYAKNNNKNAAKINIPATISYDGIVYKVTEVNSKALKGNKKAKKITIGKNVTKIGDEAFSGCTALTSLTIGSNVTTIGNKAFYNTAIKSLTLPVKVIKLGKKFIGKTGKLKTLTVKSTKLTKKSVSANACSGIGKSVVIKVPKSKVSAYTKLFQSKGLGKKVKVKANK